MAPLFSATDISKSFGRPVLANVSFDLWPGEVVALLGVSGCGKTTLLNILAGLTPADSGNIVGVDALFGYLPQSAPLLPWRTVLENTCLLKELKNPLAQKDRDAAHSHLKAVGLEGCEQAKPHELSGGMQQRVHVARLLTLSPHIYLLDEPFSQLDVRQRRIVADYFRADVVSRGAAALIVTHSIEEALFMADRVLILGGRPACIETVYRLRGTPKPEEKQLSDETAFHTVRNALLQEKTA